ncbi:hypothetical protein [Fibrella rubiginis]|uniref:hypothetical protein n=1 Tax=Fibrella rubiginis TaxID=2817060 RepID=UPI001E3912ED|nr:hypothetical protein [Fibrella rubiginis]
MKQRNRHNERIRVDYTYTVEGSIIAIIDLDQGSKSWSAGAVTNDIEDVLSDIRAKIGGLSGYAVIYRDSTGR